MDAPVTELRTQSAEKWHMEVPVTEPRTQYEAEDARCRLRG